MGNIHSVSIEKQQMLQMIRQFCSKSQTHSAPVLDESQ